MAAGARAGDGDEEEADHFHGRFVLVNEDSSGEIIGALDRSVRVHEDPSLEEMGLEDDPVVVELPEGGGGGRVLDELRDVESLVRAIPPEERDWMLKGAVFVRYVFSSSLLLSLTKKKVRKSCSDAISGYHFPHERNVHRLEHVHRALDTDILLFLHR